MRLMNPDASDKHEIAGRMYEACDLEMAIEGGHLQSVEDILAWAKDKASSLQKLMKFPVWVMDESSCIDLKASIAHNEINTKKLPESAYAALAGLKAQAGAAMMMLPGEDLAAGKKALAAAHAQIAQNETWAKKIVKELMAGNGQTTADTADDEWLERTFVEPSV